MLSLAYHFVERPPAYLQLPFGLHHEGTLLRQQLFLLYLTAHRGGALMSNHQPEVLPDEPCSFPLSSRRYGDIQAVYC
eukprot:m.218265 g.218265  ORF g.218265 m.218265 type:complete len:78 (+) comp39893_c0_seq4:96-329(+)